MGEKPLRDARGALSFETRSIVWRVRLWAYKYDPWAEDFFQ
jgi:hypothetical protein